MIALVKEKGSIPILIVVLLTILIGGYLLFPRIGTIHQFQSKNVPMMPSDPPQLPIRTNLSQITQRSPKSYNSSWVSFSDSRGYTFLYPSDWFIAGGKEAQQVQNWDPESVVRARPLIGNEAKWDVGFHLMNFTSLDKTLAQTGPEEISKIEQSKTKDGMEIYFVEGTNSYFGNTSERVPALSALVIENNKFFSWHAYTGGSDKNFEILKQIVESLKK